MVEPKVGMRVKVVSTGRVGTVSSIRGQGFCVALEDGTESIWNMPSIPGSAWSKGEIGPIDEQPKPPEPWTPKVGERVLISATIVRPIDDDGDARVRFDDNHGDVFVSLKLVRPDAAASPPQAEAKLSAILTEYGSAHGHTEDPAVTLERLIASYNNRADDALAALSKGHATCPHCADTKGMLDAACKRLGEREVEHAAALRAVDRLAAELRDYKGRARYRQ